MFLKTLAAILCVVSFTFFSFASDRNQYEVKVSTLKKKYGKKKKIPSKYETPCLIALSFFPELNHQTIRFKYKKIKTTMVARPNLINVFKAANKRSYTIIINNKAEKSQGVSFDELSINAQIGVVSHELAHLIDYSKKSSLEMLLCGWKYYHYEKFHQKMERDTDFEVIKRGLGRQLYDFTDYVINKSNASDDYKSFKKNFYFNPSEIDEAIQTMKDIY